MYMNSIGDLYLQSDFPLSDRKLLVAEWVEQDKMHLYEVSYLLFWAKCENSGTLHKDVLALMLISQHFWSLSFK